MVPPWFVHGLSIDLGVFDGATMEQPWSNHGQTMDKPWTNHEGSTFQSSIFFVNIYTEIEGLIISFL
ncbi:MAG: hypothetical protein N4A37_06840 [Prolixibacteraceae bacterium]|jgi:hypothetical protein|nr:hypothetical protein [Prolixibacteraceae bacterium]